MKTTSSMLALNTIAHPFNLIDVTSGQMLQFPPLKSYKATVILFICNHCPYVKHINGELSLLAKKYMAEEVFFLAINSNDVEQYPQDSPENMQQVALEQQYPFPYLFDETQEVAEIYQARCTPDFFVYNSELKLVYRGQLDDSRPGNSIPVTGKSLRTALDCILANEPILIEQKPSLGCNIKWKPSKSPY